MKGLNVPFLKELSYDRSIRSLSASLDGLNKQSLQFTPWASEFPYKPDVSFAIAHAGKCIFLKFFVNEKTIRAAAGFINGPVWEDACVEFFISFDQETYYNFEFNCIGTRLAAFGKGKNDRTHLPEDSIRRIKTGVFIDHNKQNGIDWELTVAIPLDVFTQHQLASLAGQECGANFYKCGDGLPDPHFVSWTNIETATPNFHVPAFFGKLVFDYE